MDYHVNLIHVWETILTTLQLPVHIFLTQIILLLFTMKTPLPLFCLILHTAELET